MNLHDITLRPVVADEEGRFKALLDAHNYLGSVAKTSHTLWYVTTWQKEWLALLVISAATWKCAARDRWIGWERRHPYDRLPPRCPIPAGRKGGGIPCRWCWPRPPGRYCAGRAAARPIAKPRPSGPHPLSLPLSPRPLRGPPRLGLGRESLHLAPRLPSIYSPAKSAASSIISA
jgi:hypothetical protein